MAFEEIQFPTDISYGSKGGPGYKTNVIALDSGAEQRVARWNQMRHRFNVAYGIKSHADLTSLKEFYIGRRGPEVGFRYKDFYDMSSAITGNGLAPELGGGVVAFSDQNIGTGDGATATFQLIKRYTSGSTVRNRNIEKPVSGTVKVGVNGVEQTESVDWTVNDTTGLITFTTIPPDTQIVAAGYEFDVPVRFGQEVDELLELDIENYGSGSSVDIPLIEVINEAQTPEEFYYGGANTQSFGANIAITLGQGRLHVLTATTTGLEAALPPTAGLQGGGPLFYVVNEGSNSFDLTDSVGSAVATLAAADFAIVALDNGVWYVGIC